MKRTITEQLFIKYANKIKDYYTNFNDIQNGLKMIGLDTYNMITLEDVFSDVFGEIFNVSDILEARNLAKLYKDKEQFSIIDISKDKYVKLVENIKNFENTINEASSIIRKATNRDWDIFYPTETFILIELVDELISGNDKYDDTYYFCFELEYGLDYKPGMVVDSDNNEIDFSTADKVFGYMFETYEK